LASRKKKKQEKLSEPIRKAMEKGREILHQVAETSRHDRKRQRERS
jgi:hypothetical protein